MMVRDIQFVTYLVSNNWIPSVLNRCSSISLSIGYVPIWAKSLFSIPPRLPKWDTFVTSHSGECHSRRACSRTNVQAILGERCNPEIYWNFSDWEVWKGVMIIILVIIYNVQINFIVFKCVLSCKARVIISGEMISVLMYLNTESLFQRPLSMIKVGSTLR